MGWTTLTVCAVESNHVLATQGVAHVASTESTERGRSLLYDGHGWYFGRVRKPRGSHHRHHGDMKKKDDEGHKGIEGGMKKDGNEGGKRVHHRRHKKEGQHGKKDHLRHKIEGRQKEGGLGHHKEGHHGTCSKSLRRCGGTKHGARFTTPCCSKTDSCKFYTKYFSQCMPKGECPLVLECRLCLDALLQLQLCSTPKCPHVYGSLWM